MTLENIKSINKLGIEGNFLSLTKGLYKKIYSKITPYGKSLNTFPYNEEIR